MAAAVARVSVLRTRLRAEAPSSSSASCSPSCSGLVGAGLAGGIGEPGGKGILVVAGLYASREAGVGDFDGRRDEWAQRRVHFERGEESFAEVSGRCAVEDFGQDVGIESSSAFGDQFVLASEVLVQRAFGNLGHRAELVHAGAVDALIAKQLL